MVHGMTKAELEALMHRVFTKADTDGSGNLDRKEFKEALKAAGLGLTRKDINLIMTTADIDRDGVISYEEFIPVCFQVCGGQLQRSGSVPRAQEGPSTSRRLYLCLQHG